MPIDRVSPESRASSAGILGQLTWLELKRVARGWRWRALVVVAVGGVFWWRREGFGPGRPGYFPLGTTGLVGFSALFGGAAALLGVDSLSQVRRVRAQRGLDTRPARDLWLAMARWIACASLVILASGLALLEMWALRRFMDLSCAVDPLLALWGFWWVPLIVVGGGLGLAIRAWVRNEAAAMFLSFGALLGLGYVGWTILAPPALFDNYAPHLGLIVPLSAYLMDVVRSLAVALAAVGLSAVGQRRWVVRTPVQSTPPYAPLAFPTVRRALGLLRQWFFTDRITATVAATLLGAAVLFSWPWVVEWQFLLLADQPWNDRTPPLPMDVTRSATPEWRIVRLEADLGTSPRDFPTFTLVAENTSTRTLTASALALSTVWDHVDVSAGGAGVRHGPVPGTWVFSWDSPFDGGTTRTLTVRASPRPGSGRIHAWARDSRYSDWGRLGAWWPRACGFDLTDRVAFIPSQPVSYRLVLGGTADVMPVCGSARARRVGDRWELESALAEAHIAPVMARFAVSTREFEGLAVQVSVFPRHEELAQFLFSIWESRFVKLRRALGSPPAAFVFHEAAIPPLHPDPLALPSTVLDSLDAARADFDAVEDNTYPQFNTAFSAWQQAMLQTWFNAAVGEPREPYLLRDSLVEYLHTIAFNQGLQVSPREARERPNPAVPFVVWRGRPLDPQPYDFREVDLPTLRLPWDDAARRGREESDTARRRAQSVHHVIRYLLGDAAYAEFVRELLARRGGPALTRDVFLALAQHHTNQPIAPIVDQILGPARLPIFEARDARVFLDRNKDTRALEYTTEVTILNKGKGRWPVPILLTTEGDQIERTTDLGPGESQTLKLVTRSRPVVFLVDPYGWLPQVPEFDVKAKMAPHARIYLKRIISRVES